MCASQCPRLHVNSADQGNGKLWEWSCQDRVIVVSMTLMYGRACGGTHEMQHYWHALFWLGRKGQRLYHTKQAMYYNLLFGIDKKPTSTSPAPWLRWTLLWMLPIDP